MYTPETGVSTFGAVFGGAASDNTGTSVWLGDLDGNGLADLAVGAPGYDGGLTNMGAVYVYRGGER